MIRQYIRERRSWILLFLFLQLLVLSIAAIDPSIPFQSLLYIVFLSVLVFAGFLFLRYQKETRFYRSLAAWDDTYDLAALADPESPFEDTAMHALSLQTERYKREVSAYRAELEGEKDDLMSWIHEVKTPMTTMQLIIERLEDPVLKSRLMYEWLRVHLLLDQQLHQKRIAFIENDLFIETTVLETIIYKEIKALQSWCLQKGIGFDVALRANEVLTDAKWLGFIVRQLLTNAVKYSKEASDIVVTSDRNEDGRIRLIIQDFGRGIDSKDLPRIFDKGFTSTIMHKDTASTGMGLYLAQKAADSLSIRIEVESKPGDGATFIMTFPKKNDFVQLTGV